MIFSVIACRRSIPSHAPLAAQLRRLLLPRAGAAARAPLGTQPRQPVGGFYRRTIALRLARQPPLVPRLPGKGSSSPRALRSVTAVTAVIAVTVVTAVTAVATTTATNYYHIVAYHYVNTQINIPCTNPPKSPHPSPPSSPQTAPDFLSPPPSRPRCPPPARPPPPPPSRPRSPTAGSASGAAPALLLGRRAAGTALPGWRAWRRFRQFRHRRRRR